MQRADLPEPAELEDARALVKTLLAGALPPAQNLVELRDAVCAYVRVAKAHGQLAEQIISDLKRLALHAVARESGARQISELTDGIVRWCIEEYYGEPAAREAQRARGEGGAPDTTRTADGAA